MSSSNCSPAARAKADWSARWAALRERDGDAWDAEAGRLDALWKDEYRAAFLAYALSRRGWTRENASAWASEIVAEALLYHAGDPVVAAHADVVACEQEAREIG